MLPSDRLFRLLAVNALLGVVIGLGFVVGLLLLDTAGLRRLIWGDPEGHLALMLLTLGFVVTCSSVMMGSAVMRHGAKDEDDDDVCGGLRAPVTVRARR